MKFASIVGARPQFIKLAPVSRALRHSDDEVIIHTGQHYDENLSATFFHELAIPAPNYVLGIGSGSHGAQTGRMLQAIEEVLLRERPDGVIVFGDTNSTLAGALAAVKLHIPVAHVEAGLRSFDRSMPEEINRIVTDHVSSRLFCPTVTAQGHAASEGIVQGVEVVGDVMYDVLLHAGPLLADRAQVLLPDLGVAPQAYVLVTVHRPSNTDNPTALRRIAQALTELAMPVVFPAHPRTRQCLVRYGISLGKQVRLLEPLGYLEMLTLERSAYRIITDSGGVQKEAFQLGVPCITLRDTTEWPETVQCGWNTLVGTSAETVVETVVETVRRPRPLPPAHNPFGEGDAATRIAQSLQVWPFPRESAPDETAVARLLPRPPPYADVAEARPVMTRAAVQAPMDTPARSE